MSRQLKCKYCGLPLNKETDEYEQVGTRYAHKKCVIAQLGIKADKEKLDNYICELFGTDFVSPKIQKQIKQYTEEYHYSYSGILKSLDYFYKVQKHDISKANEGIGIVPYIYNQAYKYYYDIYQANLKNTNKNIDTIKQPKVIEVSILNPQRKDTIPKLFSFLENDEVDYE